MNGNVKNIFFSLCFCDLVTHIQIFAKPVVLANILGLIYLIVKKQSTFDSQMKFKKEMFVFSYSISAFAILFFSPSISQNALCVFLVF